MKHIKQHLENEYKTKEYHIHKKHFSLVYGKIIMHYTQCNHYHTHYKLQFGGSKIKNIPFFTITDAVVKKKTKAGSDKIKQ